MFQKTIITLVLICLYVQIKAQDPVCRIINNLNGLPSNTVYNILQDSIGFVWMAHDKGLSKYDGKQFFHYNAKAQQGRSLSNLLCIGNTIWCQDFAGNFYYTKQHELVKETSFKSIGTYSSASILNKETIVVLNFDSIRMLNIASHKISSIKNEEGSTLASLVRNEALFFLTNKGLVSIKNGKIINVNTYQKPVTDVFFFREIANNYYGFTKNKYPYVYKLNKGDITPLYLLKKGLFIQGIDIVADEVWIHTSTGTFCFDKNFTPKYNGYCFFENYSINKVMKDNEGSYWFSTLDKGVLFVPDIDVRLFTYGNETITALQQYQGKDDIILGTSKNHILRFHKNIFYSIYKDATKHEVLDIVYNERENKIIYCSNEIIYIKNGEKIKSIIGAGKNFATINENLIAMAAASGINLISSKITNTIKLPAWLSYDNTTWSNSQYKLLSQSTRGRAVCYDSINKVLYAANSNGLFYLSETKRGEILYNNKPIFASQLQIQSGKLYAGTFSDGLYCITNNKAVLLNEKIDELTKVIYKLKIDNDKIWIVGDELIQQYNCTTNEILNYNYADGIPKAEIKDILINNNKMYAATTDGLIIFDCKKESKNINPPTIALTSFFVNNDEENLSKNNNFKSSENNIQINFSLLSYKGIESSIVQYSINGSDWQYLDNKSRQLNLPSLAPNKYEVKLRAFNEDGLACRKYVELSFTINAPFYKTSLFYWLLILLIIVFAYTYFNYRLGNAKKQNEILKQRNILEKELQQSMLSSIKSQMNPHFLFNALNTIQSYIYTNDKESASQYLGKFSELTRMILDMSNKEKVSIAEEIKALKLYIELEQLRFEDKLNCNFIVNEEVLSTETTFIPSMLIQPYVENAIKHGLLHQKGKWQLDVAFKKKDNVVEVTVEDNGIGRKRSEELKKFKNKHHKSFATNANQKRLEILNKDMDNAIALQIIDKTNEVGNATGTKVIINIPIFTKM